MRSARLIFLFAVWIVLTQTAPAQAIHPHIGYVYPAGGQQGSTFQAVVGGQNLDGAKRAHVSGDGIEVTVVEFNKPMSQTQFNTLRDRWRELREKKNEATKSGRSDSSTNAWTADDEKKLVEIRDKILKNPPNRNATPAIAETVTLAVTIGTNATAGDREIRIESSNGLSNPLRFCVGSLREFSKAPAKAPNPDVDRFFGRPPAAPEKYEARISLPGIVNGQIMPGAVDRYRFTARKGQQIVVAASARELIPYLPDAVPGWFQATLALYDSKGRELQFADDFRFRPDPVLSFAIPAEADYVMEIRDAIYRGREDFVYRITVGELPFVTSIFPLGGRVARDVSVKVDGWNLPLRQLTTHPQERGIHLLPETAEKQTINAIPFASDILPEAAEVESNNTVASAQKITTPIILNGRIDAPGDIDIFRFNGSAGAEIIAEIHARRLNSPLDSVLKLTDSSGRQLAFNDDHEDRGTGLLTHHADSYLRATLPRDGAYFIHVADAQRGGGSEYAYRLRISSPEPDFELRVVPSSVNLRNGTSVPLTVYALRKDGFTNEIELALQNAPPGFSLSGGRVPASRDTVRVTLTASAGTDAPVSLQIQGRATIHGHSVTRMACPAEDMMQAFAYRHLVPAQELMAFVSRGERRTVEIVNRAPVEIPAGGTTRVSVASSPRFPADKLHLQLSDPPEGITLEKVSLSGSGAELHLRGHTNAAPGLRGNLIVEILAKTQAGKPRAAQGGAPIAVLPAIPFEITANAQP